MSFYGSKFFGFMQGLCLFFYSYRPFHLWMYFTSSLSTKKYFAREWNKILSRVNDFFVASENMFCSCWLWCWNFFLEINCKIRMICFLNMLHKFYPTKQLLLSDKTTCFVGQNILFLVHRIKLVPLSEILNFWAGFSLYEWECDVACYLYSTNYT